MSKPATAVMASEPAPASGLGALAPFAAGPAHLRLSAALPLRRETETSAGSSPQGAILVALILALAAAVLLRARRRRPALPPAGENRRRGWLSWLPGALARPPLQVLHSTRLTPRASVHVLVWDDKEWLVGCTEQGVTMLGQRPSPAAAEEASPGPVGDARSASAGDTERRPEGQACPLS